jgi:hypothetical protein
MTKFPELADVIIHIEPPHGEAQGPRRPKAPKAKA